MVALDEAVSVFRIADGHSKPKLSAAKTKPAVAQPRLAASPARSAVSRSKPAARKVASKPLPAPKRQSDDEWEEF